MRFRIPHPRHATVVAYLALVVAGTGTAAAATGGTFLLGRSNTATAVTALSNPDGTALKLTSRAGTPPLTVNSTAKVGNLNASLLDGLSSTALQRSTSSSCSFAVKSISPSGATTCTTAPALRTLTVTAPIGNAGGTVTCPPGWVVTGGGFNLPDQSSTAARDYVRESAPTSSRVSFPADSWTVVLDPAAMNVNLDPPIGDRLTVP